MTRIWTPAPVAQGDRCVFSAWEIEAYEREILANPQATEHDASRFFRRLPKFLHLGAGVEVRAEVVLVGSDQRVDFFRRLYGEKYWDIVELKGPRKPLITGGKTHHPRLSSAVEQAICQARDYRDLINDDGRIRADLASKGITVCRPQMMVVVGQNSGEVDPERLRILYDRVRSSGALDPRSYTDLHMFAKEYYVRTKTIVIPVLHFQKPVVHLPLPANLHLRHPAMSAGLSECMDEAARVCFEERDAGPIELLVESGDSRLPTVMQLAPADERMRRAWADRSTAAELAARGLALAAIEASEGLVAIYHTEMCSGADYMLGEAGETPKSLEDTIRLDISSVNHGGADAVESRLQRRMQQLAQHSRTRDSMACGVDFQSRRIVFRVSTPP